MQKPSLPTSTSKKALSAAFAAGLAVGVFLTSQFNGAATGPAPAPGTDKEIAVGDVIKGPVAASQIHDGDTVAITQNGKRYAIRLWGADTPEIRQICKDAHSNIVACGQMARDEAVRLIDDKPLSCEIKALDKHYNRVVGKCTTEAGKDLGRELVRTGYAYTEEHSDDYIDEQAYAEDHKLGLWAGKEFMNPKEWRNHCLAGPKGTERPDYCRALNKR